jgi:hypothetical protein
VPAAAQRFAADGDVARAYLGGDLAQPRSSA